MKPSRGTVFAAVVGWCADLAILAGVCWKDFDVRRNVFFSPAPEGFHSAQLVSFAVIYAVGVFCSWTLSPDRRRVSRLCLVLGPSVLMSLLRVVQLYQHSPDFVYKEVQRAMIERKVPADYMDQWLRDRASAMKSERRTCALHLACVFLLYVQRFAEECRAAEARAASRDSPDGIERSMIAGRSPGTVESARDGEVSGADPLASSFDRGGQLTRLGD